MKISIKTQTDRTTDFKENYNCVNLFLDNFEVGLITREWGETKEGEHRIIFRVENQNYEIALDKFIKLFKELIK